MRINKLLRSPTKAYETSPKTKIDRRIPTVYYMLLCFAVFLQNLEVRKHVERDNENYENRGEDLCPAREERVDGTSLVFREIRVGSAGYNAETLLVTLLKNDDNNDRDSYDRKQNAQYNT